MAKKVIIQGEGLLENLNDDWGGVNETLETIKPYPDSPTEVPPGRKWGMNKGEVEDFIKAQFGTKCGDIRWEKPDDENYYYLLVFDTKAHALAWDADPQSVVPIARKQLPISTVQADAYYASLATSKTGSSANSPFVFKRGESYAIPLRLNAWKIMSATGQEILLTGMNGTLTVEMSLDGGASWSTTRLTESISLANTDASDSFPDSIDIGSFVDTGQDTGVTPIQVRFTVSVPYTDSEGNNAVMTTQPMIIYVKTVTLSIALDDDNWRRPNTVNGGYSLQQFRFTFQGNVGKKLHVRISNTESVFSYQYDTPANEVINELYKYITPNDTTQLAGLTDSGVHEVMAWVTCDNGEGGELESEITRHQFIVVNTTSPDNAMRRYVLLQSMETSVDNFVRSKICDYLVWNPKLVDGQIQNDNTEQVMVRFVVASEYNILYDHETYMSLPVTVTPGVSMELNGTIEIESDIVENYYEAYLFALDENDEMLLNDATYFRIDNSAGFQPVSGAYFQLNPKTRDNGEATPQTIINARSGEIVDSDWGDNFKMDSSDGYTTDEQGNKVLRVPAGRKLTISLNPFAQIFSDPYSSLAIDMQFRVRNVTNEQDPIFRIAEKPSNVDYYLGLMMRPMDGTMVSRKSNGVTGSTDFRWAEDRIEHLCVTITPNIKPYLGDSFYSDNYAENINNTLNLVRVYVNGCIIRELEYNVGNATEFCTGLMSNGGIIIGQEGTDGRNSGADIDIYGIRVYARNLRMADVFQNYISALPSTEEKLREKARNNILKDDGIKLSLRKCNDAGLNTTTAHIDEMPMNGGVSSTKGWVEQKYYDYDGTYRPEYSGTFCKETKALSFKGQGTTAMTYYYWNLQADFSKLKDTDVITIALSTFHSSIVIGTPVESDGDWTVPIYGGCLGKDYPVGNGTKSYPCTVDGDGNVLTITVPDGWIDGNGFYRGPCWQAGPNKPLSQKLVLKINYASSMQSHLIGVNWLYNALHTAFCGENSLQQGTPTEYKAQVAKQVIPVLFFTAGKNMTDEQTTLDSAVYQGPGGFGPGKMDKPTWGYSSKYSGHSHFGLFEGAANNTVLSDFLAPWDDTDHLDGNGNVIQAAKVKYWLHDPVSPQNKDPESFYYRKTRLVDGVVENDWEKGIGFDAGKTGRTIEEDGLLANENSCDDPEEAPKANITAIVRAAWNYVYMHNPNIIPYVEGNGTFESFQQRSFTAEELKRKWVCKENTTVNAKYLLKRWDYCERQWVDAGLWNETNHSYDEIDIRYAFDLDWDSLPQNKKGVDKVTEEYKKRLAADAYPSANNAGIGAYFKSTSLRFHYAFINTFIAGTDNCSKNTYYMIDPSTHLIELNQDDVDTVLPTDNFGFQSKPYYIDRTHPYPDGSNVSGYDGMFNGLFDLVESLWLDDDNHTISKDLAQVLRLMENLTGGIGSAESNSMTGVWRSLNKYLFDIQRYIPKVAYNEAARIRYEFPAALGFVGRDGAAPPLAQSMGDQLEAEIQFMKRRLIYMTSYAGYGEFAYAIGNAERGTIGIADMSATFATPMTTLPNGDSPSYVFRLKPHQYIYPCFYAQSTQYMRYVRLAPDQEGVFEFNNITPNPDYNFCLPGLNYYHSIGNVGDMSGSGLNFVLNLQGSRLTEFVAEPTYYYPTAGGERITAEYWASLSDAEKTNYQPAFRPQSASVSDSYGATRLRKLSLKGLSTITHPAEIPIELNRLVVVEEIDLRGTNIAAVRLPQTSTLETLRLPAGITSLTLNGQPNLSTLDLDGYANLTSLIANGCPLIMGNRMMLVIDSMRQQEVSATHIELEGINWTGMILQDMRYLISIGDSGTCLLSGTIAMSTLLQQQMSYDDVAKLMQRYGDIRSQNNSLYVSYQIAVIGTNDIGIGGRKYVIPSWLDGVPSSANPIPWSPTEEHPDAGLWLTVDEGNNVEADVVTDGQGNVTYQGPAVTWSLIGEDDNLYAEFPDPHSPVLMIKSIYKGKEVTVRVSVRTTSATLTYDKKVGLWNRVPEVGDFAWSDGTFDNEDDTSKKMVGTVVMREPLEYVNDTDDSIITYAEWMQLEPAARAGYSMGKTRLWVIGMGNASSPSSTYGGDGTTGSADIPSCYEGSSAYPMTTAWGIYPSNSTTSGVGLKDTKDSDNVYQDDILAMIQERLNGKTIYGKVNSMTSDVFDTPLPNLSADLTITPSSYQSSSNNNPTIGRTDNADGTGVVSGGTVGDGTGYLQKSSGGTYAYEDYATIYNNKAAMAWADEMLVAVIQGLGIDMGNLPEGVDPQTGIPRTRQGYADMTLLIQRYIAARIQTTDEENPVDPSEADLTIRIEGNNNKTLAVYRQIMMPAFRLCNVWCPADVSNSGINEDKLDPQYARGKWMLPSNGLESRIFNFLYNSSCTKTVDPDTGVITYGSRSNGAVVNRANHNGNDGYVKEGQLALFSNIVERSNGRRSVSLSTSSVHWTGTENYRSSGRHVGFNNGNTSTNYKYNGLVVRPVAAFIFVP